MTSIVLGNPFLDKTFPITQYFGANPSAYSCFNLGGHSGVDFDCPIGTPIYASYTGLITKIGYDPIGYGNFVRITTHFGRVIGAHLQDVIVEEGMNIEMGEMIGYSGDTGGATYPHYHFEMRIDDNTQEYSGYCNAVNPLLYLINVHSIPGIISQYIS